MRANDLVLFPILERELRAAPVGPGPVLSSLPASSPKSAGLGALSGGAEQEAESMSVLDEIVTQLRTVVSTFSIADCTPFMFVIVESSRVSRPVLVILAVLSAAVNFHAVQGLDLVHGLVVPGFALAVSPR